MIKANVPSECPRCGSIQKFLPTFVTIEEVPIENTCIIEVIIRCNICKYTDILRKSTLELENLRRSRNAIKHEIYIRRKDLEPVVMQNQLCKINRLIQIKELELRKALGK